MGSSSASLNFEIATPPGWVQVPTSRLDEDQLQDWLGRISRLAEIGIPPAITSISNLLLEGFNNNMSVFGAYFLDVFNDQEDEPPYVVYAMLTIIPGSLNGEECPSPTDLAEQAKSTYGNSLKSVHEIRTNDGIDCLSASMITKKTFGSGEDQIDTEYLDLRIFVPLPEFDQIVSLLFVTPNVELEEEFRGLFESIASTLRFEAAPEEELTPS